MRLDPITLNLLGQTLTTKTNIAWLKKDVIVTKKLSNKFFYTVILSVSQRSPPPKYNSVSINSSLFYLLVYNPCKNAHSAKGLTVNVA